MPSISANAMFRLIGSCYEHEIELYPNTIYTVVSGNLHSPHSAHGTDFFSHHSTA